MSAADFEVRQEPDEVRARVLVSVGVASIVIGAAGVFFGGLLVSVVVGSLRPDYAPPGGPRAAPRELSGIEQTPIWQTKAGEDLREAQQRDLERFGWVDRKAGIANIPIDRAMDLVVEESR
jgi:hypothetical protein